jgi:hypothetical protein
MKITPLQFLLLNKNIPLAQVRQAVGCTRVLLWRWSKGISFPKRGNVERLIELYGPDQLDFNGCFVASREITDDQARLFGLTNNHADVN